MNKTNLSSTKSKKTATILCILLGVLGVHRDYVGKFASGSLLASIFIVGLLNNIPFLIGVAVLLVIKDLILIRMDLFLDRAGLPLND